MEYYVKYFIHDMTKKLFFTVQHGSADTVVRAMNVKYRKWRLVGVLQLRNPSTDFHKTWHQ